ncbi:SdrD B-like domain-containing protein [Zavarzinella formosa]|uniref:SdrD B-like domain-containing protein n=1 Tax=Zavarzinella formosa TaxID=360055 RepID=UPI0002FBD97D|nr:SdrD B-like domain-containing protein [Zavarzinella formosa]
MRWVEWLLKQSVSTAQTVSPRKARLAVLTLEDRSVPSVAGFVFRDLDGDGVRDVGTPQTEPAGHTPAIIPRTEPGLPGVAVKAFAPGGTVPIETVFTASDGSYALTTSLPSVRIEFSGLPAGYGFGNPSPQAAASNVRFVNASTNPTGVNLATVLTTQASPYLVTPVYTQGNQITGPQAAQGVVVGIPYNSSGGPGGAIPLATASQVGATWAVASNTTTGAVYVGAYMKRYTGFGPSGTGAIYKLQPTYNNLGQLTGSQTPVLFADLSVVLGGAAGGTAATTGDNPHPNTFDTNKFKTDNDGNNDGTPDNITNGSVGKIGLGGMVMSPDNQFLYVMNLNTRQLIRLGVDANGNFNGTHAEFNVPVPAGVAPSDVRPFAVQYQNGQVYVGLVDSAESTGLRSDLKGYVYTFNPATSSFGAAPVLQFQLDYAHGDANVQKSTNPPPNVIQLNNGFYQPWNDNIDPSTNGDNYYASPMLSDIVFDDTGAMIVGIRDRQGDQSAPGTTPSQIFGEAGDILRATPNGSGGFNLEGQPGGPVGVADGQGPNGREFYADDNFTGLHDETSLGALAVLPGSGQVVVNSTDPGGITDAAGPVWMDNTTGRERDNFNVYTGGVNTFAKANGLGDLQIIYAPAALTIGNRVWYDTNGNGLQDAAEPGIQGVTVQLFQNGNLVGSTVTNALGEYVFDDTDVNNGTPGDTSDDGVKPNTAYQIRIATGQAPLAGKRPSTPNAGADNIDSDGIDNGTSVTYDIVSGSNGTFDDNSDFGFVPRMSIGNRIWNDVNNNGIQDAGEAGISGVAVVLLDTSNNVLASTTSGANGIYEFSNLLPGNYQVRLSSSNFRAGGVLEGYASSTGANGQATGPFEGAATPNPTSNFSDTDDNGTTNGVLGTLGVIDSGIITLTADSEPLGENPGPVDATVTDANSNLTVDFGVFQKHTLGNVIFEDANNNGVQDPTETGITGVTVNLYDATGTTLLTSSFTNAQGQYLFSLLAPGSYVVEVAASNFNVGGPLAAYRSSTGTNGSASGPSEPAPGPNNNIDGVDDGTTSGTLGAGGVVRALPVTLGTDEPLNETPNNDTTSLTPDNQSNLTVDFGFFRPLSLGNQVFLDSNNDGFRQTGETGINGVLVDLLNASGGVVASTTTATVGPDSGIYRFDNLGAGQYRVRLTAPNFTGAGSLVGFNNSSVNQTDPNTDINDDNNGITVGTLGSGGVIQSNLIDLSVGNEPITDGDTNPNTNLTLDFGVFSRHSIGNRVFNDANNNGTQDPGESGIANVAVQLLDGTGTNILASTTTDINGLYLFTGIAPGSYVVRIPASNFSSALANFASSTGNPGFLTPTPFEGAATPNPNTNPSDTDDNGTTVSGNVQSLPVTINDTAPLLESPNNDPGTPDNLSNLTIDFGFFQKAAINGRVFVDTNNNGVIDPTETTGLPGVTIQAVGPAGTITTTTGADGSYSFDNLPAGSYTVSEPTQPPGYGSSTPNNPPAITVPAGGTGVVNFGETQGSLAGRVWLNYNNQQDFNGPDTAIPGVTITLTGTDSGGNPVNRTTTTDATGNYNFANVAGGNYVITETQPTGGTFPPNTDGIDFIGTVGSPGTVGADSFTLTLPAGTVLTGYNFTEIPLVSLAGSVYEDVNGNGTKDSGEPGIGGVVVTLTGTNVSGTPVNTTATTSADGSYAFANLQPGTNYTLTEGVVPAPFLDGKEQNGTPAASGTGVNDAFSGINLTTLAGGGAGFNFGEVRPVSIAGQVYVDANNNGMRDGAEGPIPGVTLRLSGTDDTGAGVSLNTVTLADGSYSFPNLRPGTYTVSEVQPANFGDGLDSVGNRGGNNTTNDVLSNIVLTSGQAGTGYNFGETNSIDLAITETISKTVAKVGDVVTITYTVKNNGPSQGTGVVMSAPLPSGLSYVSTVFNQQGTYNKATGLWTIGTLNNGAQVQLQIQVKITKAGTFSDPASVTGDGTETTLANNFANVPITATIPASQVTKRKFLSSDFA